jgi:hypothetical protein
MTMEMERRGARIVNLLAYKAERAKQRAQAAEPRVSALARSAWRLPSSRQIAHRQQMLENLTRSAVRSSGGHKGGPYGVVARSRVGAAPVAAQPVTLSLS